jgi:hypothetical protein
MPLSSLVPGSRQPILGITQGLCFLSHPAYLWRMVGAYSVDPLMSGEPCLRATDRLLRSVCPFVHDRRLVLYAGFPSSGCHVSLEYMAWNLSLLGLPGISQRWQDGLDDASTIPSLSLAIATCSTVWPRLARG